MAFTLHQIASYGQEIQALGSEGGHRFLRDDADTLYAVGVDGRVTSVVVLFKSTDNGQNWTTEEILDLADSDRYVTSTPNFVLDGLGNFHIVFKAMNTISGWDEICYITGYELNWAALSVLATPEVMNLASPDICLDSGGVIYALWMEEGTPNYDVVVQIIGSAPTVITTAANIGYGCRIVAGPANGELHAVWLSDPDADYSMALVYGFFDGADWSFTEFDPLDTGMSPEPFTGEAQVLVDINGTIHIFCPYYENPTYYTSVFHYYNAGAGWIGPTLIHEETAGAMFSMGNPTSDVDGVVYLPISRCDLLDGDLDPPGSMIVYKYDTAVWSTADTFVCDAGYVAKGCSLISPSNGNGGYIGGFDYGLVTDTFQWTIESDPTCIVAEVVVFTYHLEFYYDGQSQGSTDSGVIFLPLVTDEEIYKLIGIKNISGDPMQGVNVSAVSAHGTVSFALGSSGDTQTDGKMKTYSENVFTPSIANGATTYVWMKWKNTTPRYAGANTIQLTNVVY